MWEQGFPQRPPTFISLPEAYAYVPQAKTVLMEDVGGDSLKRLLKSGRARPEHMRLFAEVLVKLQRFPLMFGAPFTLEDHLALRCRGQCGPLADALPELARPIERIVEAAARQREHVFVLSHGDYHPGQVQLGVHRLWLLDPDPMSWDDPAYDVAMACMVLKRMGSERGREAYFRRLCDVFLSTYFARMDLGTATRIPLNAPLIHLKRACKRLLFQGSSADEIRLEIRQASECLTMQGEVGRLYDLDDVIRLSWRCAAAG